MCSVQPAFVYPASASGKEFPAAGQTGSLKTAWFGKELALVEMQIPGYEKTIANLSQVAQIKKCQVLAANQTLQINVILISATGIWRKIARLTNSLFFWKSPCVQAYVSLIEVSLVQLFKNNVSAFYRHLINDYSHQGKFSKKISERQRGSYLCSELWKRSNNPERKFLFFIWHMQLHRVTAFSLFWEMFHFFKVFCL